ncbi:MAG: hypothetical protein RBR15_12900 [Sphaerochaeta sp.]|nr:hypothetical protein [Sphaerochaeta sp.]
MAGLEPVEDRQTFYRNTCTGGFTYVGSSTIFPFGSFKERFDKRIEKACLDGRYGAVLLIV